MAVKIRLARGGAKKRPYYRMVVANASSPRDGDFIEKVGTYNPMLPNGDENRVILNKDRVEYWLSQGATPTERVAMFMASAGVQLPGRVSKKIEIKIKNRAVRAPRKRENRRKANRAAAKSAV